jgi:hypothetical protein
MTDLPEKNYKHLTDEDLGILLGGYRVIKFKDDPKELKGVDVPTGLELVYEIQRRLKKSGPNISWDQTEDRRQQQPEENAGLPVVISVAEILDNPEFVIKQFDMAISVLTLYKTYPTWWPVMLKAREEFVAGVVYHANLFIHGERDPKDYFFYFPQLPNMVLEKINDERAKQGSEPKFFFIGLKAEKDQLLQ